MSQETEGIPEAEAKPVLRFSEASIAFRHSWRLKPLAADTPLERIVDVLNGMALHFHGIEEQFAERFTFSDMWEKTTGSVQEPTP